jgi:hypothetical protein
MGTKKSSNSAAAGAQPWKPEGILSAKVAWRDGNLIRGKRGQERRSRCSKGKFNLRMK